LNGLLPAYATAWLSRTSGEVALNAAAEGEMSVGVTVTGTYKGSVSVSVRCTPTRSALERWRLDTYAALLDAHRNWQAQYDNERRAIQARSGIVIEGSSPARNREIIREELKRLVIEMLYGNRFTGIAAVDRSSSATVPPFVNLDAAADSAAEIQFLEQIFEWDKMTYVLYPYYWATSDQWADLMPIEGADPEYAQFLRSGSARVVVAARSGYDKAVNHWLWYGRPWGGGSTPTPDQDDYISIADEIRGLNQAPDEGEPQDSWEVRLPTTLVWLDPHPALPKYNSAPRLDEPVDPRGRLCRPAPPGEEGRDA
jgi:hypothetical protein